MNKKWMMLSALVGSILLIGVAAANPMFTETVMQRMLGSAFSEYLETENAYPLTVHMETANLPVSRETMDGVSEAAVRFGEASGLPVLNSSVYYASLQMKTETDLLRDDREENFTVGTLTDMQAHIRLLYGKGMSDGIGADGVIDAVVSEKCLIGRSLLLDEVLTFEKYSLPDGRPLKLRVAGVFENSADTDPYWAVSPSDYAYTLFIDETLFKRLYYTPACDYTMRADWYLTLDQDALRVEDIDRLLSAKTACEAAVTGKYGQSAEDRFTGLLDDFRRSEKKIRTTFIVLQVPSFVLLFVFMIMVSKQMLGLEQGEIAVLKSRGASRGEILLIYIIQNTLTQLAGLILAIPFAFLMVRILACADGFLTFVPRSDLRIRLNTAAVLYALGAALAGIAAMTLPVLRYSAATIVSQKRKKHRNTAAPFWEKYGLDIVILLVSLYGLYSFNNQKELLAERVLRGEPLDPLLFLSSSLFMLGAGLFALRLIPLLEKLVFGCFRQRWNAPLYSAFIRIIRSRKEQGFIVVFLSMTIAIGLFDAVAARTIETNAADNIRCLNGADAVIGEQWRDNSFQAARDPEIRLTFEEPDFERFGQLGAESVTKVVNLYDGTVSLTQGSLSDVRIMGIHTKSFGETADFDTTLLGHHWFNDLNLLAERSEAVIVSENFRSVLGFEVGDYISFRSRRFDTPVRAVIAAFADYWPGFAPVSSEMNSEGVCEDRENYLVVANLAALQEAFGVIPYEVWLKTGENIDPIYDFAENDPYPVIKFTDTRADILARKNDAVLQGTNGILTLGFIVALIVCAVGFLIFWILSVRSRELHFGVFRAMGMSMKDIFSILVTEQLFISGGSIAAGAGTGMLTAVLFIPLIQIAYASSDSVIPLKLVCEASDMTRLFITAGVMVVLCLAVLVVFIRRLKIAQALKLGED